jgi:molybdenum cofactor synthesis domain-containing protein
MRPGSLRYLSSLRAPRYRSLESLSPANTRRLSRLYQSSNMATNQSQNRTVSTQTGPGSSTSSSASDSANEVPSFPDLDFAVSPLPPNPLGEGNHIRTAAALVIGDEILNGKTHDKNSNVFARFCFDNGIELKRIEVVPDDEAEIIEASRRMVQNYDFVITSGGIGPTHDDITYASLAKAFDQNLVHHTETLKRMSILARTRASLAEQNEEQKTAMHRMALFPEKGEVLYVGRDLWVPVIRLEGKLCILPGIPGLFQKMLHGLTPYLPLPPPSKRPLRMQIFTSRPESMIAPFLTDLQRRVKDSDIQVGSYPQMMKGVYVSLIGRDKAKVEQFAEEVVKETEGKIVCEEEVQQIKSKA